VKPKRPAEKSFTSGLTPQGDFDNLILPSRKRPSDQSGALKGPQNESSRPGIGNGCTVCNTVGLHVGRARASMPNVQRGRGIFFVVKGLTARKSFDILSNRRWCKSACRQAQQRWFFDI